MYGHSRRLIPSIVVVAVAVVILFQVPSFAASVGDTLWVGNDQDTRIAVLNVDKSGNVLRSTMAGGVTGIAIDAANQDLYMANTGAPITRYDLATLALEQTIVQTPSTLGGEDMAFDGTYVYRADYLNNVLYRVDPTTGVATTLIGSGLAGAMGVAWDGSHLWVSEFDAGRVRRFTAGGVATGEGFSVTLGTNQKAGGLAWDTTDNTLWLGSHSSIYHYTTGGVQLASFATPDRRFVDGLEYQGVAVPLPAAVYGGALLVGVVVIRARLRHLFATGQ